MIDDAHGFGWEIAVSSVQTRPRCILVVLAADRSAMSDGLTPQLRLQQVRRRMRSPDIMLITMMFPCLGSASLELR